MAKVSSARPSSRQSQEGAAATRTTRSTRSQSGEPVEQQSTALRPGSRGGQEGAAATPKKRAGRKAKNATGKLAVYCCWAYEEETLPYHRIP